MIFSVDCTGLISYLARMAWGSNKSIKGVETTGLILNLVDVGLVALGQRPPSIGIVFSFDMHK